MKFSVFNQENKKKIHMTLTHQCQILDSEPKKKKIESIQEGNKLDD